MPESPDPIPVEERRGRRALVVDRDAAWRSRVLEALAEEPVEIEEVENATEAFERAKADPPDLVLSELDLPDVTGPGMIRMLRVEPLLATTPIIVITHFEREVDRIVAFEMGVVDYVIKPFFARELAGRVRAVLRRTGRSEPLGAESRVRRLGGLELDPESRTVSVDDRPVSLTPREFDLLAVLMGDVGRVLSRDRLVEAVWGSDDGTQRRSVDTHVKTIRRKLGRKRSFIETVRGVGYRFSDR